MEARAPGRSDGEREGPLTAGIIGILLVGTLIGLAYNGFGLASGRRGWGLDWIATDRMAQIGSAPAVGVAAGGTGETDPYATYSDDPLGIAAPADRLPEIPAAGRPVTIELAALKLYVDAGAALVLDARDPSEFAAGHIPGAINVPFDLVASDPSVIETLGPPDRPAVTYCGGGRCEVSIGLADELLFAGYQRVAVYLGGFPEWQEAGYPVATGGGER